MKVLIGAPVCAGKDYSLGLWLDWIKNQSYKDYEVALCVNGEGKDELLSQVNDFPFTDIHNQNKKVIGLTYDDSKLWTGIQKITYARECIRRYAVNNNFDYIFWMDTDTIPMFLDSINILMAQNKDSISGLYFYKEGATPVAIDKETGMNFDAKTIREAGISKAVIECEATGYGCVLHSKKVMLVPFDFALFGRYLTDDIGHCFALKNEGIIRYFMPYVICKHLQDPKHKSKKDVYKFIKNVEVKFDD